MQLTCEQQHILSHDIQDDHVVKIIAFAGMWSWRRCDCHCSSWPILQSLNSQNTPTLVSLTSGFAGVELEAHSGSPDQWKIIESHR